MAHIYCPALPSTEPGQVLLFQVLPLTRDVQILIYLVAYMVTRHVWRFEQSPCFPTSGRFFFFPPCLLRCLSSSHLFFLFG